MIKYLLTPLSKVVGESTQLEVRWRGQHTIPKGSYIFIDFPKWNPENPLAYNQKSYIQGSEKCQPLKVFSESMSCDFSDDRLIVSGATPALIPADTEVAFTLSGFKNPIETGFVDGFKISTRVRSGSDFYVVDEDVSSLTVSEYATLSNAKLSVKDPDDNPLAGMIQEVNDMRLDFYLPVPLNEGCKVHVALPEEYSVSEIQRVMTFNVFGYYQNYTENLGNLFIDLDDNSFSIEACKNYVENDGIATITMFSLT